jgi:hypothetical protein
MRSTLYILVFSLVPFIVLSCVSTTTTSQRFADSAGAAAPVTNIDVTDPQNFSFAMVGDLHIGNQGVQRLNEIITAAQAENDAFIVFLGDLVQDGNAADVTAFRTAMANSVYAQKFAPVIGNHDIFNDGWKYYLQSNGASHYTFTAGNSEFIVMDTGDGTLGNDQLAWLQGVLGQNLPSNTFMLSHYGPQVPQIQTYLKLADLDEATKILKLAVTNGVRGWYAAHYHSYVTGTINGVDLVIAGGGGGQRMPPYAGFFYVQVTVQGTKVSYQPHSIN